jgi:uncharacterized protein (DUF4415 family)
MKKLSERKAPHLRLVHEEHEKMNRKIHSNLVRVRKLTDKQIAKAVASDPDAAPLLEDWPADVQISIPHNKVPISLRVDADILAFFKHQGKGYLTHINAVLRAYMRARIRSKTA